MRDLIKVAAFVAAGLWCLADTAQAQTAGFQKVPEEQQRIGESLQGSSEAARQSQQSQEFEGQEVTYDQVLAHPDDPWLNSAYAKTLIRKGDLLGAAVTLERILMTHPDAAELRLLYGLVLFRLEDDATAKSVLSAIPANALNSAQNGERENVLAQIETRSKRLHQAMSLALGPHFDTNRNAGARTIQILDATYPAPYSNYPKKDWGTLAQIGYEADYDLGTDPRTSVFGALNLYGDRQSTVTAFNILSGGGEFGLRREIGPWRMQGSVFWNQLSLQTHYYMNDYGVDLKATRRLDNDWDTFAEFRLEDQVFHNIPANPTGSEYGGLVPSGWLGLDWRPTAAQTVSASAGISRRDAQRDYNSGSRYAARLSDSIVLPQGQFVVGASEFGTALYAQPDPLISTAQRHDRDMRLDLTYGVPFGTIGGLFDAELPPTVNSVVFSVTGEYYREVSNITNYTYSNLRAQALVSKRWEF